jgi:carboxymethylenebutenolidase
MARTIDFKIGPVTTTAVVAAPSGAGKCPGVVVTFYREGLDGFTHWLVDDLARNGFVAIAPNHFHVLPPGKGPEDRKHYLTDEQMALDLRAAAAWLAEQDTVAGRTFGLLGHCMGGRTTWLGLADSPELWACGGVWYGGGATRQMGKVPPPSERLGAITAPVIGFFGNDDKNPSPAEVNEFDAILTKLSKVHEFHRYDHTDHGFMNADSPKYHEGPAKESWARGLAFFRQYLGIESHARA